jgi:hypothetical protein
LDFITYFLFNEFTVAPGASLTQCSLCLPIEKASCFQVFAKTNDSKLYKKPNSDLPELDFVA